jgi:hypothetical protein
MRLSVCVNRLIDYETISLCKMATMKEKPDFMHGLELCRRFYWDAVRPILDAAFPGLPHSAALIGHGSEVLGFDDVMSTDHHWGPRAMLFLAEDGPNDYAQMIRDVLARRLPRTFLGYPTNWSLPDPADNGVQGLVEATDGPINHRVDVLTVRQFILDDLAFDIADPLTPADWLTFPSQKLRTLTAGAVYHDDVGLQAIRDRFAYYPKDVWLYLLACGWERIGQEEAFVGRTGMVGDEIGSALIAGRLVRDLIMLCFLMERQYPPYAKWFGTAFSRLAYAATLGAQLRRVLAAEACQEREQRLVPAYEQVVALHNALGLTDPVVPAVQPFFSRPFMVTCGWRIADRLREQITDPEVRRIAGRRPIGSIDQWSDSTDLREAAGLRMRLAALYE